MGSCHRRIHFSMQKEILANECFIVSHFGLPLIFQPCIPVLIRPFLVSIPSWHINHSLSMGTLRSADLHLIVELHSVSSFHPYSMAITYLRERWTSGHPPYHICQRIVAFGEPPKEFICFRQISKTRKKTPKFADFLHFKEFSFGFGKDNNKCIDFLLTDICSIPLPIYVPLLMILPQQDFHVKCQQGQSLRYGWLASGGSAAGCTSPHHNRPS